MNPVVGSVLVSETDKLRVWHLMVPAGQRCTFHRHVLDYFWTCHSHGRARGYYEDGSITETTHYPGDTMHLSYAAGEYMLHSVENVGDTDLLFTTVEFLDSANAAAADSRRRRRHRRRWPERPSGSRSRAGELSMYAPAGVKTAKNFRSPRRMRAWVLGDPGELSFTEKPVPVPKRGRGAGAHRCGRDLRHRPRGHRARAAGADPRRPAVQQELDAGPRIHGHRRRARARASTSSRSATASRWRSMPAAASASAAARACTRPASTTASTTATSTRATAPTASPPTAASAEYAGQQHQHAGPHRRHHVGRGGDAGGHRRHGHVRPDRARRADRRRERGGDRARARSGCWAWRWPRRWAPSR